MLPAVSERRLSETSYLVLGMLEHTQPATPYDLKQVAELSSKYFWSIPHSLLYSECERLAKEGLLIEEREPEGRRRRIYSVTKAGTDALEAWRAEPGRAVSELRDLSYLKLFLGADPAMLAKAYLPEHEATLRRFEELRDAGGGIQVPRGPWLAFDAGMRHMRESVRFWRQILEEEAVEEERAEASADEKRAEAVAEEAGGE